MGLAADLLELLFPLGCPLCGEPVDGTDPSRARGGPEPRAHLGCARHRLGARPPAPRCGRCDGALPEPLAHGSACAACRRRPLRLARVRALADYGDPRARAWVLALKHGGRRDLARPLGELLARRLGDPEGGTGPARRARGAADALLVPVPLHPLRRLERGHDQAALLARETYLAGGPPFLHALRRLRATAPQGDPRAPSRSGNVRGAFGPREGVGGRLRGRDVWLVDDVLTSGSSAEACARVLRRLGARRVSALVVLRAAGGERGT